MQYHINNVIGIMQCDALSSTKNYAVLKRILYAIRKWEDITI